MKYVALLRGINVGGNNKVAMGELRTCFEGLGFTNVGTYINSGNVLFESSQTDEVKLAAQCEAAIRKQCGFRVVVAIISAGALQAAVAHAPKWWDLAADVPTKHNALFVIAPATAKDIVQQVGEPKLEYEKMAHYGQVIFWSAPVATFGRTRYSKIVALPAYQAVTIRNANTTKKLALLVSA